MNIILSINVLAETPVPAKPKQNLIPVFTELPAEIIAKDIIDKATELGIH